MTNFINVILVFIMIQMTLRYHLNADKMQTTFIHVILVFIMIQMTLRYHLNADKKQTTNSTVQITIRSNQHGGLKR
jgi:hypothetical protein